MRLIIVIIITLTILTSCQNSKKEYHFQYGDSRFMVRHIPEYDSIHIYYIFKDSLPDGVYYAHDSARIVIPFDTIIYRKYIRLTGTFKGNKKEGVWLDRVYSEDEDKPFLKQKTIFRDGFYKEVIRYANPKMDTSAIYIYSDSAVLFNDWKISKEYVSDELSIFENIDSNNLTEKYYSKNKELYMYAIIYHSYDSFNTSVYHGDGNLDYIYHSVSYSDSNIVVKFDTNNNIISREYYYKGVLY